ncbi:EAL domain-containing protein [Acidobacteria bacterium AB60]|nr:EAL domain-containing protein [Acidobacteria bacterium AB60]
MNLPENANSVQQREILDALPALVFLERAGKIVFANAAARRAMGVADAEWVQRPVEEVVWGLFPGAAEPHSLLPGATGTSAFHATLACKGGMAPLEGTYCILNPELREGIIVANLATRDRSAKPRLMEDVLASIPEAVAIVGNGRVLYINPAFTHMFGFQPEEVTGGNLRDFIVPETRQHENAMLNKLLTEQGRACVETVRVTKGGELLDVAMQIAPLMVNGGVSGHVMTYRDIGERKQVEAKLQHDAMHDVLTGLPNRALFYDRLQLALSRRTRRKDQGCGVLFLDLDGFKKLNDTLGHAAGDMLLIAVAQKLRAVLRPQDTAARFGGDEFGVLVENITSSTDMDTIAQRLLSELDRPFDILGHRVRAVVSIGAAMAGQEHDSPDLLLRDADFAMYRAKQEGGHRCEIFDRQMKLHVTFQQERERELRHVLTKREFELWYQPVFRLSTGRVEGFESLLRWRRADGSIDSFRDLLPVAEDTGLSVSIGRDTFEIACRQLQSWMATIPGNSLIMSMNVSQRQFFHDDMIGQLRRVLESTAVDPSRLMLEVAESTINESPDRALAIFQRMVDCGVRIAIDNFGSNLAPLNHLVRLPIDVVKMDPKLTIAATGIGRQLALVESLIHVCKSVGVQLLAQGIETHEQLRVWQELGCELGQGYLLAHALEPARAHSLAARSLRAITSNV